MKDAYLKGIAEGTETHIVSQNGNIGFVTQEKLDALGDAMKQGGSIEYVNLTGNIPQGLNCSKFAEGLKHSPELSTISLSDNTLTKQTTQDFAAGLRCNPSLTSIDLSGCNLDSEGVILVADALATCPNMRNINFNGNTIDTDAAKAIGQMMQSLPMLEVLKAANTEMGHEGLRAIADAIPSCRRLVEIDCKEPILTQRSGDIMLGALQKEANPNLIILHPSNLATDEYRKANRARAIDHKTQLIECDGNFDSLPASQIGQIYDLMPCIQRATGGKIAAATQLEKYIADMPIAPDAPTLQTLTEKHGDDRTVLDNPDTWLQLPKLIDKLAANGERLTLDFLQQSNRDGESYLQVGLATAPEVVIPALNAQGIQLTGDVLLQDGKPTPEFNAVLSRNAGSELFTYKNWEGHSSAEMRGVCRQLPEAQRNQIRGYHSLSAQLETEQSCEHGMGR